MEMMIHLHPEIFDVVKNGEKNIEVRLNDEKRRLLKVGDTIKFLKRPLEEDTLMCRVIGLDYYNDFQSLVEHYDMKNLYLKSYSKDDFLKLLGQFYTIDDQKEWGVVAIKFEKID